MLLHLYAGLTSLVLIFILQLLRASMIIGMHKTHRLNRSTSGCVEGWIVLMMPVIGISIIIIIIIISMRMMLLPLLLLLASPRRASVRVRYGAVCLVKESMRVIAHWMVVVVVRCACVSVWCVECWSLTIDEVLVSPIDDGPHGQQSMQPIMLHGMNQTTRRKLAMQGRGKTERNRAQCGGWV